MHVEAYAACLGLAAFLNSLRNGFVFDDNLAIVNNKDALSSSPHAPLWGNDFWGRSLRTESSHKSYRPLTMLSYRLNSWLLGGGAPECSVRECSGSFGYHLANALLHAAVCALVARLTLVCTGTARLARTRALIAGATFALHPVHCEAVVNVVGRAELLTAALVILAYLQHARAAAAGARGAPLAAQAGRMCACCALFGLALLCKETALFAVLVLPAHEVLVVLQASRSPLRAAPPAPRAAIAAAPAGDAAADPADEAAAAAPSTAPAAACARLIAPFDPARLRATVRGGAARLLPPALLGCAYLAMRVAIMSHPIDAASEEGARKLALAAARRGPLAALPPHWSWAETKPSVRLVRKAENPLSSVRGSRPLAFFLSALHVNCCHLLLLLWPAQLSIEYSYDCVPLVASLADPRAALDLLAASLVVGFGLSRLARAAASGAPAACRDVRCLAWALLPWLPASHLLFPIGTYIAERLLYLPSVGAAMLLAQLAAPSSSRAPPRPPARPRERLLSAALLGLLCAAAASRTLVRNLDWLNNDTAFGAALRVCPRSAKLQMQTGVRLLGEGNVSGALSRFDAARSIDAAFCDLDFQEAKARLATGNVRAAVPLLNASLTCAFTVNSALPMLMELYRTLSTQFPNDSWLQGYMASTFRAMGAQAQADAHYAQATRLCAQQGNYTCARAHGASRAELLRGACGPARELALVAAAELRGAPGGGGGGVEGAPAGPAHGAALGQVGGAERALVLELVRAAAADCAQSSQGEALAAELAALEGAMLISVPPPQAGDEHR